MASVPAVGSAPLQAPEAVHDVALALLQFKVLPAPADTDDGVAVSATVGAAVTTVGPGEDDVVDVERAAGTA